MTEKLRILILEDSATDAILMERELKKNGMSFVSQRVEDRSEFVRVLKTFKPTLILSDYKLPRFDALSALKLSKKMAPQLPFIVVTGSVSEEVAVECMKLGADDYLLKDRLARLPEAVKHALETHRLQIEKIRAEETLRNNEIQYRTFIDASTDMAFLKDSHFRHLLANQALCRFYGKPENEIIGKTDSELMDKNAAAKCRRSDKQTLDENRIHVSEETAGDLTFETRKFPVKLADGRIGIGGYIREISERKHAEDAIRESADFLNRIINAVADPLFVKDSKHHFILINDALETLIGQAKQDIVGKSDSDFFPKEQVDIFWRQDDQVLETGKENINEEQITDAENVVHTIVTKKTLYTDGTNKKHVVGVIRDISERKHAEEQIRASLLEKEVLLKEIHHRVKNNLQVISGLLTLQGAQINDERLQKLIKESQGRIWTMALIHQTLYQSGNLADIDMADYIRNLCGNLLSSYAQVAMPPTISFDLVTVHLVVDKAIPLALIINELITNAMKHAFPHGRPGEISIALREYGDRLQPVTTDTKDTAANLDRVLTEYIDITPREGTALRVPTHELTISDNGVGLPEGFDPKTQKSLGLQLVTMLAKQLGGSLAIESGTGTSVHIIFSNNEKKEKQF